MPLQDSTPDLIPSADFDADALAPRELRVVLVCDVVESVRWMEQDEDYAVSRWQAFTQHVRSTIVPAHGGSVVKSTGDGMMVEFPSARSAVQAAAALHAHAAQGNTDPAPQRHLQLRTGIHETHARRDAHDLYGHGVNLAARITTLAGPGEIIVSAPVRDHLTDALDGDIEDMGECYLKHIAEPQRVYRVGAASVQPVLVPQWGYAASLQPTIAVIPLEARSNEPEHFSIGELIADGVIGQLSRSADLKVISRLSATAFRGRGASTEEIQKSLGANYILSGSYWVVGNQGGGKILLSVELSDTKSNHIVAFERFTTDLGDLLDGQSATAIDIAQMCCQSILHCEASKVKLQPTATLAAYTLKLSGISLMHRSQVSDFEKSHDILSALSERHQKSADSYAWLAKWHVLRVIRGISAKPKEDAIKSIDACRRALDSAPDHSLALAVKGYALCQLMGQSDDARHLLDLAKKLAPNEVHAWLYRSVWSSNYGDTQEAVVEAEQARLLSPCDPHAYFFETILASAYACNREYDKAIQSAKRSLKMDYNHAPTLRTLMLAQFESGDDQAAIHTLEQLKLVLPQLSIAQYESMGSRESPSRRRVVAALRALKVPEVL
jgi:adenylate cyclase